MKVVTGLLGVMSPSFVTSSQPPDTSILQPDSEWYAEPEPMAFMLATQGSSEMETIFSDTMTMDEALRQPDRENFIEAMHKELNDHIKRGHWKVVLKDAIPSEQKAFPMVWSMKQKRNQVGEITNLKARLCAGGYKSIEGLDY